MAYSVAFSQAIAILIYIVVKTQAKKYEYLSTKSISGYLQMSFPTTVKILKNLSDAGLISAKEGSGGGIMLSRQPADITLLDIFIALEHNKPLFKTQFSLEKKTNQVMQLKKKVQNSLLVAEQSMKAALKKTTLANFLNT